MSFQLTAGGGEILFIRDKGTPNTVQGFISEETVVSKNTTELTTNFLFQLYEYIQYPLSTGTIIWLKVAGVWKQTIVWIKVAGIWKQGTTYFKVNDEWK